MRKRSNIDIVAAILSAAKEGAKKKSHIAYKTKLNFEAANRYLNRLQIAGLLTVPSDNSRRYQITFKGNKFLRHYEILTSYIADGG